MDRSTAKSAVAAFRAKMRAIAAERMYERWRHAVIAAGGRAPEWGALLKNEVAGWVALAGAYDVHDEAAP